MTDGQAVGFRSFVNIICRNHAARAGHVFDDDGRIARYMFSHMATDGARVGVVTAAGSEADNETNGFTLEKIRLRMGDLHRSTADNKNTQEQLRKPCHAVSLWRA